MLSTSIDNETRAALETYLPRAIEIGRERVSAGEPWSVDLFAECFVASMDEHRTRIKALLADSHQKTALAASIGIEVFGTLMAEKVESNRLQVVYRAGGQL